MNDGSQAYSLGCHYNFSIHELVVVIVVNRRRSVAVKAASSVVAGCALVARLAHPHP